MGFDSDGFYKFGPIPGIGGPFSTAKEYFAAWVEHTEYPTSEKKLRRMAPGAFQEELVAGPRNFKGAIEKFNQQNLLTIDNEGPFRLCHGDFGTHNLVINDKYDILGVIDWENSFAGPVNIFATFPISLSSTPQPADAPWLYDDQGIPLDEDTKIILAEQKLYTEAMRKAEEALVEEAGFCLSKAFDDTLRMQLATSMIQFSQGKGALYGRMVDAFRKAI